MSESLGSSPYIHHCCFSHVYLKKKQNKTKPKKKHKKQKQKKNHKKQKTKKETVKPPLDHIVNNVKLQVLKKKCEQQHVTNQSINKSINQ